MPDPSNPTGLGYPDSPLYASIAQDLLDIYTTITDANPYTYFQDPADGRLYFAVSAGYLLDPQIGVTYRVPVDQIVGPATYDRMEQGLTTTTNEPAYTDDYGSWISTYSPILDDDGQSVGAIGVDYPLTYVAVRPGRRAEAAVPGARHQLRRAARARARPLDLPDPTTQAAHRGDRAHRRRRVRPRRAGDGADAVPRRDVHARRVGLHAWPRRSGPASDP